MEISSEAQKLCHNLISLAIQRCRVSENLCRLSIVLKCSNDRNRSIVRVAISDTGIGSCLAEFQELECTTNRVFAEKWDGLLSVTTTGTSDIEVYRYQLNTKEIVAARRLTRLPSTPKNRGKFSGTEVSFSTNESLEDLVAWINRFLQKMVIVKFPKIAVEFMVDYSNESGSRCENLLLANDDVRFPSPLSNIERLISALQDNILKHGNSSDIVCGSCFSSREAMKVGSGMLCSEDNLRSKGQEVIEVVIVILELPEPSNPSCLKACNSTTEVSYFEEFLPCLIPQSSVNSLTSIDWKSYGLSLRTNLVGEGGHMVLEWENLPPFTHIDIAIHCYHKQIMIPQVRRKTQFDRNLVKKAIILAMDDLKEKYTGVLLSAHAVKIQSYVPDFAKTITGLILSSNDIDFQKECISILGLKSQDADEKKVEGCIRKKITAVIETNDRKPQRNRESAPFLFEDDRNEEPKFEDEEDAGEEDFDLLDL